MSTHSAVRALVLGLAVAAALGVGLAASSAPAHAEIIEVAQNAHGCVIIGRGNQPPASFECGECPSSGQLRVSAFISGPNESSVIGRAACQFGHAMGIPAECKATVAVAPPRVRGTEDCTGFGTKIIGALVCTASAEKAGEAGWYVNCNRRDP